MNQVKILLILLNKYLLCKKNKLVNYYETDSCQLFNIKKDPEELNNLADNLEYKSIVKTGIEEIFENS